MLVWMQERDLFLEELLRLEGPEIDQEYCATNACLSIGLYRCPQCTDSRLFCNICTVQRHEASPFHIVEVRITTVFLALMNSPSWAEMELALFRTLLPAVARPLYPTRAPLGCVVLQSYPRL